MTYGLEANELLDEAAALAIEANASLGLGNLQCRSGRGLEPGWT